MTRPLRPFDLLRRLTLGLAALLPSCAPSDLLNATIPTADVTITQAVPYGAGPRRMMDIYRPAGDQTGLPIVVFFYGGSWNSGERGTYKFVAAELAKRGMVVAVPDYRVYPEVRFPAFIDDAAQAVAFARAHATEYGANPDRLFIAGHSAGAHIAAMLALDPAYLAAAGDSRDRLAGMIGISGPYDFLPLTDPAVIAVFAGSALATTQPINYVDGRNPPMLLLHGDADTTVSPGNTTRLSAKIRAAGGPVQTKFYPGVGHIGIVLAFAPLFRGIAPTLDDVSAFVLRPVTQAPAAAASPAVAK